MIGFLSDMACVSRWVRGKDSLVDLGKGQMAAQTVQLDAVLRLIIFSQQPLVARLTNIMFHTVFILRYQQILLSVRLIK